MININLARRIAAAVSESPPSQREQLALFIGWVVDAPLRESLTGETHFDLRPVDVDLATVRSIFESEGYSFLTGVVDGKGRSVVRLSWALPTADGTEQD